MSNQIESLSVNIGPVDGRCRYWAKIIRAGEPIPAPHMIYGANDVLAAYCRRGEEELFPGDVLIEGEANHHRRTDRRWTYRVIWMNASGEKCRVFPNAGVKAALKAGGLEPALLAGSGEVAACIRIIHGLRAGIPFPIPD